MNLRQKRKSLKKSGKEHLAMFDFSRQTKYAIKSIRAFQQVINFMNEQFASVARRQNTTTSKGAEND